MSTLEKAIEIAAQAHARQKDKIGKPYILHPLRVMLAVNTMQEKIVAVLHDVLEDTNLLEENIREAGFTEDIMSALVAMSRKWDDNMKIKEPYQQYLERVRENPIARSVKIADLTDNMSPMRLYQLEPDDQTRLKKKYQRALAFLEE